MKRLLAYLFLVLGLGLVFSVNSWAPIKKIEQPLGSKFKCKQTDVIEWYAYVKSVDYN